MPRKAWLLLPLLLLPVVAKAQLLQRLLQVPTDTSYISEHDKDLTIRPFAEQNFNQYNFFRRPGTRLTYQPNAPLQASLGLSYRIIGVGLGFALPVVNKYGKYGKGNITDLSTHFYLRRFNVDVFYQYYTGQHLKDPAKIIRDYPGGTTYIRNDIVTKALGIGVEYITRPTTFSMEPFAFVHYQKKSAGSWLIGIHLSRTGIQADSALLPAAATDQDVFSGYPLIKSLSWNATTNAGYAYTLVYKRHLFITAAVNAGFGVGFATLSGGVERIHGSGLLLNAVYRIMAGYNSEQYFAGLQFTGYSGYQSLPLPGLYQEYNIGRLNITVARRLLLKKRLLGFY